MRGVSARATLASIAVGRAVTDALARGVPPTDSVTLQGLQEAAFADERGALNAMAERCTELLSAREGFAIDAAFGLASEFPGGRARDGRVSDIGFWLTSAHLGRNFSNIGVARLQWDVAGTTTRRILDIGGRSVYAWDDFAGSLEVVYRTVRQGDVRDFVRFSALFDVKIGDQSWLSLTLGRDFDPKAENSLLALLGFKWQIGEQRIMPRIARQ